MKNIMLDFTKEQPTRDKEKIIISVNDNIVSLQILLDGDADLTFVGSQDIMRNNTKLDIGNSDFADQIVNGEYKNPTVRNVMFQLSDNVDTQQVSKITILSEFHKRKHSYYFISNKM